jgi:Flp pilus assembly protein TadD
MRRGRGFVLTELGRLDEAEAAYRESLKIEPDSERAKNELQYIARLKAGGPSAPYALGLTPPPKNPK